MDDEVKAGREEDVRELISVIEEVANGRYSDRIMKFTGSGYGETVRRLAEAVGLMMVKVEAREFRLKGLVEELKDLNENIKTNTIKTVVTVANALGARDTYTQGHALRVSGYASRLAQRMGLAHEEVESIAIGGLLHDIGKIGFSDRMFSETDVVDVNDLLREIHRHPEIGMEILKDLDFLGDVRDYVLSHHERADGKGYPRGLSSEAIPAGAMVIGIADCFDAITTKRSYQEAQPREKAFAILREMAGSSFPEDLVEAFIKEVEENGME